MTNGENFQLPDPEQKQPRARRGQAGSSWSSRLSLSGADNAFEAALLSPVTIEVYRDEPVLVATVDVGQQPDMASAVAAVNAALNGQPYTEYRWTPRPSLVAEWPQPSLRTLEMERAEPELVKGLDEVHSRHQLDPNFKHESE